MRGSVFPIALHYGTVSKFPEEGMELEKNVSPKGESQEKRGETRNKRWNETKKQLGGENKDIVDRIEAKTKQNSKTKAL